MPHPTFPLGKKVPSKYAYRKLEKNMFRLNGSTKILMLKLNWFNLNILSFHFQK